MPLCFFAISRYRRDPRLPTFPYFLFPDGSLPSLKQAPEIWPLYCPPFKASQRNPGEDPQPQFFLSTFRDPQPELHRPKLTHQRSQEERKRWPIAAATIGATAPLLSKAQTERRGGEWTLPLSDGGGKEGPRTCPGQTPPSPRVDFLYILRQIHLSAPTCLCSPGKGVFPLPFSILPTHVRNGTAFSAPG